MILASGLAPIAISRGLPKWPLRYQIAGHLLELAPRREVFHLPRPAFEHAYGRQLEELDLGALAGRFRAIADVAGVAGCVLLCFEDVRLPDAWCHRTLFAQLWQERTGEAVPELGEPTCPDCGAPWTTRELRCPSCGLASEDVEAAADFLDRLDLDAG